MPRGGVDRLHAREHLFFTAHDRLPCVEHSLSRWFASARQGHCLLKRRSRSTQFAHLLGSARGLTLLMPAFLAPLT